MAFDRYSGCARFLFSAFVLVLIGLDYSVGTFTTASVPFYDAILAVGRHMVRNRVKDIVNGKLRVEDFAGEHGEYDVQALASND